MGLGDIVGLSGRAEVLAVLAELIVGVLLGGVLAVGGQIGLPSVASVAGASRGSVAEAVWLAPPAWPLWPAALIDAGGFAGALLVADGPASQAPSARASALAPINDATLIV